MDRHFLFLLSSSRSGGNSEVLARRAAATAKGTHRWIDLADTPMPSFVDERPALPHRPAGQLAVIATAMRAADDIVFVAPVYWYALPAPAKLLLDHWSGWLDVPGFGLTDWLKGKRLWLITARADPDPTVVDEITSALHKSGQWLGMDWRGALHGIGDAAGDVLQDSAALAAAAGFFDISEGGECHSLPQGQKLP